MRKLIFIISGLVLLTGFGTCFYLVSNVSATLPPIKEYEFQGSISELITKIKLFSSTKPNISFTVGEILGDQSNGYAYDGTIKVKDQSQDLLYELKFEEKSANKTKVLLIGAHDLINNNGGYGINAVGMKLLLQKFDSDYHKLLK